MWRYLTLFIWIGLLYPLPSFALVVADPGAYVRFAQQLQETKSLLHEAKNQKNLLDSIKSKFEGTHQFGAELLQSIHQLDQQITQTHQQLLTLVGTHNTIENTQEWLDSIYLPSADKTYRTIAKSAPYHHLQTLLKSTLMHAEVTLTSTGKSLKTLTTLSQQIDTAPDMKTAIDLNNKLTLMLLKGQQQVIALLADANRTQAALHYQGTPTHTSSDQETTNKIGQAFHNGLRLSGTNTACDPLFDQLLGCH
jgi:hypothetical protein